MSRWAKGERRCLRMVGVAKPTAIVCPQVLWGLFVTRMYGVAEQYANSRAHERKSTPAVIEADDKDIGPYFDIVPNSHAGERVIPVEQFGNVPAGGFRPAG